MRVRDWMSPDPVSVEPSTSVREARRLLGYYGIRHLPVVVNDRVVGIVSDRDVRMDDNVLEIVASAEGAGEATGGGRPVEALMSSPVHTIGPDEPVEAAARMMLSRRISAVPVVDRDNRLVGVITSTDCLLASLRPQTFTRSSEFTS
jgi:acetoin utilization protein AcuB